ncbi:MAG: protoporphyrinogen oxidase [Desulfobacterales bacterium]|nr:MAG: protoporphyrinogen oxidase [Desulfobacterales bacterium]
MTEHRDTVIIGGGLSGLVVAHRLKRLTPNRKIVVLEKDSMPGGVIRSFEESGFRAERGPHGFLDNCPQSRQLLKETGLDKERVKAPLGTFVRYVCINGKLQMIPQTPLKIIREPLIPWKDKFRVLGDLFIKPVAGEPSVADWAARRFGHALLPYVDAVFTGTYAGDYDKLKIDAVMPGVRALEKEYGSVIKGAIARARMAKKEKRKGEKLEIPAMTSFPNGMQRLTDRLSELLEPDRELLCDCTVSRVIRKETNWQITSTRKTLNADHVVIALPVNKSLELLQETDSTMILDSIPESWLVTVVLGFKGGELPPGFGFLIPDIENRFSLGTLFSSNMFPNRAPDGHIVFETLVGGRRHPEKCTLDDQELIDRCLVDAGALLSIHDQPVYTKVLRPVGAIPQLESGYPALLDWRNDLVKNHRGLYVCGFGWDGIGINDMIKTAWAIGEKLARNRAQHQEETELKKVYF